VAFNQHTTTTQQTALYAGAEQNVIVPVRKLERGHRDWGDLEGLSCSHQLSSKASPDEIYAVPIGEYLA